MTLLKGETLFESIFSRRKPIIIAMLHVFDGCLREQTEKALEDLDKLNPFVDGAIVENYGWGYFNSNLATDEVKKILLEITKKVVENTRVPVGVNILPNDYEKAFYVASLAGGKFIQLDHVTGEFVGHQSVDPDHFLKMRSFYSGIAVLGGIHPKYYTLKNPLTPIGESALTAKPLTDAVVVTGSRTGGETSLKDIRQVKETVGAHPVLVGSGLNVINAQTQLTLADGAIVGTALKKNGFLGESVDDEQVRKLIAKVEGLR